MILSHFSYRIQRSSIMAVVILRRHPASGYGLCKDLKFCTVFKTCWTTASTALSATTLLVDAINSFTADISQEDLTSSLTLLKEWKFETCDHASQV